MARPDEATVQLYHNPLKDYPEHGPGTFRYPLPRKRRPSAENIADALPGGPPAPGGAAAPSGVFVWPFHVSVVTGGRRATAVSPAIPGPCLIRQVHITIANLGGAGAGVSLYWSLDNSGFAEDTTDTTPPSGTRIFLPIGFAHSGSTFPDTAREAYSLQGTVVAAVTGTVFDLCYPVPIAGQIYLKLSVMPVAAVAGGVNGLMRAVSYPSVDAMMQAIN